ncbi:MAG: hypothetical protein ACFBWO_08000 [Paracoccaceae bacterium]
MLGIWAETFMTAARTDREPAAGSIPHRPRRVATPDEAPGETRPVIAPRRGPRSRPARSPA